MHGFSMNSKAIRKLISISLATTLSISLSVAALAAESELTGLPIDDSIIEQRPIAVMVDNEKIALNHFGTGEADIVYEMVNSTANGRVTRLMCIYKDWANIKQTGSIRSIRTTNSPLAAEYNAIMIHDGGPFYINAYLANPWADHLSGGFARIKNGKRTEFTEYVTASVLNSKIAKSKISRTYNAYQPARRAHFLFNPTEALLQGGTPANVVNLSGSFIHNRSKLYYNPATMTYDYYDYDMIHVDGEDAQVLTFKNVILQCVPLTQLDANGYMNYETVGSGQGFYMTDGAVVPISWRKDNMTAPTRYFNAQGQEILLNKGKTYIGLIPADTWATTAIG